MTVILSSQDLGKDRLCERKQFSFALMERMRCWMNYDFMAVLSIKENIYWHEVIVEHSSHDEESLTRHNGLLAVMAFGGVLIRIALGAQQLLIFSGEGLVHQWALALEAVETVLMPVTVLVGQILKQQKTTVLVEFDSFWEILKRFLCKWDE